MLMFEFDNHKRVKAAVMSESAVLTQRERVFSSGVAASVPNAVTIAAMLEAERMESDPTVRRYTDVEEALRELKI
jgi:hypothetical protein